MLQNWSRVREIHWADKGWWNIGRASQENLLWCIRKISYIVLWWGLKHDDCSILNSFFSCLWIIFYVFYHLVVTCFSHWTADMLPWSVESGESTAVFVSKTGAYRIGLYCNRISKLRVVKWNLQNLRRRHFLKPFIEFQQINMEIRVCTTPMVYKRHKYNCTISSLLHNHVIWGSAPWTSVFYYSSDPTKAFRLVSVNGNRTNLIKYIHRLARACKCIFACRCEIGCAVTREATVSWLWRFWCIWSFLLHTHSRWQNLNQIQ